MFGPGSGQADPMFVSETEREVEAKFVVNRISSKLLTKMGKIGGTATMTSFMPKGAFLTLRKKLSSFEPTLQPRPNEVDVRPKI